MGRRERRKEKGKDKYSPNNSDTCTCTLHCPVSPPSLPRVFVHFVIHIRQAFVGFTAGTGRSWAKHDVLSWYWCHNDGAGLGQEGADRTLHASPTLTVPRLDRDTTTNILCTRSPFGTSGLASTPVTTTLRAEKFRCVFKDYMQ